MSAVSSMPPTIRQRLIQRLSTGRFYSGEQLAAELVLSRTAVWKHIASLRKSGLAIDAVRGKGYRLMTEIELLDRDSIIEAIDATCMAQLGDILLFPALPSTNDYLLQQPSLATREVVIAEQQTAGRGRQGRSWLAPFGSITLSLGWRFQRAAAAMSGLTLALAMAVICAMESGREQKIGVKWPNDIVFEGNKLAGILVEMRGQSHGPVDIVMGVGVNMDMPAEWSQRIAQPVTDMKTVYGKSLSRNRLIADLISHLVDVCQRFDESGFAPFKESWLQRDQYRGQPVVLRMDECIHTGLNQGVDDSGALLLRQGERTHAFHSGDIELSRFEI